MMLDKDHRVGLASPDDCDLYIEESAQEGVAAVLWAGGDFAELDREDLERVHAWIGRKLGEVGS